MEGDRVTLGGTKVVVYQDRGSREIVRETKEEAQLLAAQMAGTFGLRVEVLQVAGVVAEAIAVPNGEQQAA